MRQRSNFGGSQRLVVEYGDRPRESRSIIHRRKSLLESTLSRGFEEGFVTTIESQLVVLGQAVTRGSTPSRIRTYDLRIRSPLLYPAELWAP